MKNIKKEIVYCEDEVVPYKIGYSLGTVYDIENNKYKLYNFGYCPSKNDYYCNDNIHLPKKVKKEISRLEVDEFNSVVIEELYGVLNKDKVFRIINKSSSKVELKNKVYIKR